MRIPSALLAISALVGMASAAVADEPRPTAVFPVELADTSGEGPKPGQPERLELATDTLVQALERTGRYRAVDLAPFAEAVAATAPRYDCAGCWLEVARESGAELAVIAVVHKVSTLVSTVSIWVADLETDTYVARAQGQLRGETDTAYVRAIDFLVDGQLGSE
jgi:hypothetical protein